VTKVLYVEDNDDNIFMLKMRLELLGDFEVLTAEDGEKGCAMAVGERPDIILMDLEMPVVDACTFVGKRLGVRLADSCCKCPSAELHAWASL